MHFHKSSAAQFPALAFPARELGPGSPVLSNRLLDDLLPTIYIQIPFVADSDPGRPFAARTDIEYVSKRISGS